MQNLFKTNNKDTTTTSRTSFWCLYCCNLEQISRIVLVIPLLTSSRCQLGSWCCDHLFHFYETYLENEHKCYENKITQAEMYSFENVAIFKFLLIRQIDVFNCKIMQSHSHLSIQHLSIVKGKQFKLTNVKQKRLLHFYRRNLIKLN